MWTSDPDSCVDCPAGDEEDCGGFKPSSPQLTRPAPPWTTPSTPPVCSEPTRVRRTNGRGDWKAGGHRRVKRASCGTCGSVQKPSPAGPVLGSYATGLGQLTRTGDGGGGGRRRRARGPAQEVTEKTCFSQKRTQLQPYFRPLSHILLRLRSGRYSHRLSRFQESLVMDRIQRIMGVLQNPDRGGRLLGTLPKIETMLQSWFPHVTRTQDRTLARKLQQRPTQPPLPPPSLCPLSAHLARSTRLRRLHASPICWLKGCEPSAGWPTASSAPPHPAPRHPAAIQDNRVSSSTDSQRGPLRQPQPRRGAPPIQSRSPCLETLLGAKESITAPQTAANRRSRQPGWLS
ncbi:uncharacterized protein LOC130111402 [Lampris incognitus]|uniref:uncharacterized protein LOC130111402 n=1 Tax=Lampris incognitus TaxID=2546036 RepID=UPI0024B62CA3|nr:uncharacterized protein LOC130111402 [Lampris incognitus]XP_056134555.1 uncharacterized protein LOC130111402 [Lampris incognitus]XP_056134556.1 uncharacterized protein LOC130111402 [Lampris incognitus]